MPRRQNRFEKSNFKRKGSTNAKKNPSSHHFSTAFEDEYEPPFKLGAKWRAKEYYKLKLPHPYLQDQIDTFNFPIIDAETALCDRAQFARQLLDLMVAGTFDNNNGPLLYYTAKRSMIGLCREEWDTTISTRTENAMTRETFIDDMTAWTQIHESRDAAELLQSQRAYMTRLLKPNKQTNS